MAINARLGVARQHGHAADRRRRRTAPLTPPRSRSSPRTSNAGAIQTLLILGGNPAYDAPADLELREADLPTAPNSIHLSIYRNETSLRVRVASAQAHYLESWGDARA